jgi:hypothetical protein
LKKFLFLVTAAILNGGKYVKQTSSQEPLDGLEPYLAEMFLARFLSGVVTFCSDRPPFKMAAVTKNRNFFNCPLLL